MSHEVTATDVHWQSGIVTPAEELRMSVKVELTCVVCRKAIKLGESHFRIGDARIHVKCYEKMQTGKP